MTKTYTVDDLYNLSETLTQAGDNVNQHEDKYNSIIEAVMEDQDPSVRALATQLIVRYFKHFPSRAEDAFESIVPLCENVDVDIRKRANMALVAICRENKDFAPRLTEILIQLFQSNDQSELNLVNASLGHLLNLDIKAFLTSFFEGFANCEYPQNDDETELVRVKSVRERALKFLTTRLPLTQSNLITKEIEEMILESSKKIMDHEVNREEFILFISLLSKLKIAKTVQGQAAILEAISTKACLDESEFDPSDPDMIDGLLLCARNAIPLFSQYNRSSRYVQFICNKLLPHLDLLSNLSLNLSLSAPATAAPTTQSSNQSGDLPILQALAEMSPFLELVDVPAIINIQACQSMVFNKLFDYMPLAPTSDGSDTKLTQIEFLMYTFHQLGRLNNDFFDKLKQNTDENRAKIMRDWRIKLQHLATFCQKQTELLAVQLAGISEQDMRKDENAARQIQLRRAKNCTLMIRDLFKNPPQFKAVTTVTLSCKPAPAPPRSQATIPVPPVRPSKNQRSATNSPHNPVAKRQRVDQSFYNARNVHNQRYQKVYRR